MCLASACNISIAENEMQVQARASLLNLAANGIRPLVAQVTAHCARPVKAQISVRRGTAIQNLQGLVSPDAWRVDIGDGRSSQRRVVQHLNLAVRRPSREILSI